MYNIDNIILLILQGKASVREKEFFDQWLLENKTNRQVFQSLQAYWLQKESNQAEMQIKKEKIWVSRKRKQRKNIDWRPLQAAAAIVFIMLTLGYLLKDEFFNSGQEPIAKPVISMINKSAASGAKLETILPDGSLVKLNSESTLRYPHNFNDSLREVYLEGEAYFEVTHNPEKPFSVISQDVKTTVLGTAFVVSAYQEVNAVCVALASGKVETQILNTKDASITKLIPGEYISYNQKEARKGKFDQKELFGWKDGLLFFKNNTFDQVIPKLERWYGVEIILEGKKPDWKLNGEYKNANLESIMEAMSYSQEFEYEFVNEKLIKIINK